MFNFDRKNLLSKYEIYEIFKLMLNFMKLTITFHSLYPNNEN